MMSKATCMTCAAVIAATQANAEITLFAASLSGLNEVPANASPAAGTFFGEYDSISNSFSFTWNITDNLIGAPSSPGAHLHMAPLGVNGPVIFGFANSDGTWPLSGSTVWNGLASEHVTALFAGEVYANFHTDAFPGGEIRGQLTVVPSPGAGIAAVGLGIGLAVRRRRG